MTSHQLLPVWKLWAVLHLENREDEANHLYALLHFAQSKIDEDAAKPFTVSAPMPQSPRFCQD